MDHAIWFFLLAAPWLTVPFCAVLARRGRMVRAILLPVLVWITSFGALYAFSLHRSGGKLIGGPSGALSAAFDLGAVAVALALALVAINALHRRIRANKPVSAKGQR